MILNQTIPIHKLFFFEVTNLSDRVSLLLLFSICSNIPLSYYTELVPWCVNPQNLSLNPSLSPCLSGCHSNSSKIMGVASVRSPFQVTALASGSDLTLPCTPYRQQCSPTWHTPSPSTLSPFWRSCWPKTQAACSSHIHSDPITTVALSHPGARHTTRK
jgi:hypothetical protein